MGFSGGSFDNVLIALVGLAVGSFISLISYRLPLDEPIVAGRSRCPSCKKPLRVVDLFPVLSWAWFRGRCRQCKAKVSWRYPATEIITALAFLWLHARYGFTPDFYILSALAVCVITLIITDLEHYIIPDEIQIAMLLLGVAYRVAHETPAEEMLSGFALGLGIGLSMCYGYKWLRKKDGLGFGDVKLLAVVGLWLGAMPMVPYLFLSGVLGVLTAGLWRLLGRGALFPFGPALVISFLIFLFWPQGAEIFWQGRLITH